MSVVRFSFPPQHSPLRRRILQGTLAAGALTLAPGDLLAYATSPGNTASDGDGANGLCTENLLREIKAPDARIEDVFKRVRLGVRRRSNGQQIPLQSTSLEEDFYFLPPREMRKVSEAEATRRYEEELAVWERIKTASDPAPLEEYLRRYPSGLFSEIINPAPK